MSSSKVKQSLVFPKLTTLYRLLHFTHSVRPLSATDSSRTLSRKICPTSPSQNQRLPSPHHHRNCHRHFHQYSPIHPRTHRFSCFPAAVYSSSASSVTACVSSSSTLSYRDPWGLYRLRVSADASAHKDSSNTPPRTPPSHRRRPLLSGDAFSLPSNATTVDFDSISPVTQLRPPESSPNRP